MAQLELIRALRELVASLADVDRVLSRELDVVGLVALQLEVVEAQLRVLRVRRAVPMAAASGEPGAQELRNMTRLAHISDDERKRIVEDFLDDVLGGLEIDPGLEERLRGGLPQLPDDPAPEQVEALVAERGGAALEAGIAPWSEEAERVVAEILAAFAAEPGASGRGAPGEGEAHGRRSDVAERARTELADRFEQGADPGAERYWQLLAVINGWPPVPTTMPAWHWTIDALRARPGG